MMDSGSLVVCLRAIRDDRGQESVAQPIYIQNQHSFEYIDGMMNDCAYTS